jgi:hypothetical protein
VAEQDAACIRRGLLKRLGVTPAEDRERLEWECRAALPATVSEGMARAVLPGMIAARLRQGPHDDAV